MPGCGTSELRVSEKHARRKGAPEEKGKEKEEKSAKT